MNDATVHHPADTALAVFDPIRDAIKAGAIRHVSILY